MTARRQPSASAKRKKPASGKKPKKKAIIHPEMNVAEIVALHEDAATVLATYGLHCVGCAYNQLESLREGAESHGLTDDDIGNLVEDLTELIESAPPRPHILTVTEAAARALLAIAETEGKLGHVLRVTSDDSGGFCMEFEEECQKEDLRFSHTAVPALTLVAAPETLARIGGSTIDHRDGRFKLDLPGQGGGCGCEGGTCGCRK